LIAALTIAKDKTLSVREVAEAQGVPYTFARNIQHDLVRSGFIQSVRGSKGGMRLVRDPHEMTLLELIEAVQSKISVAVCAKEHDWCDREHGCPFHPVWEGLNSIIYDYLGSVSVADIIEGKKPFLSDGIKAVF
jgi:Rrf2 family protein